MGLFRRSNELDAERSGDKTIVMGTPAQTTQTTQTTQPAHHHHAARDGVLAGGLAHHEANGHPGRDGVLAGAAVSEVQHHRNEKELRHNNGTGITGHNSNNTYGTTGTGVAGTGHNSLGHDAVAAGGVGAGVGAAGAGHSHGTTGTHTGPAPLTGVNASSTGAGGPNAKPTLAQAHKLDRKAGLESTMGGLLCSSSLKHKSQVHRAEADHLRMQASELGEAERLEHEAGLRRQRAVGLGADPAHATGQTGFAGHGGVTGRTAQVA